MIRLRHWIDRALEHRWFGFAVLLVLVVLLSLTAFHMLADEVLEPAATICSAIVLLVTLSFTLARPPAVGTCRAISGRSPPRLASRVHQQRFRVALALLATPLRR